MSTKISLCIYQLRLSQSYNSPQRRVVPMGLPFPYLEQADHLQKAADIRFAGILDHALRSRRGSAWAGKLEEGRWPAELCRRLPPRFRRVDLCCDI